MAILVTIVCGSPGSAQAMAQWQSAHRTTVATVSEDTVPLSRRVTLKLRDTPLRDVLETINVLAGLRLSYSHDVVPFNKRISIELRESPASHALATALKGTGIVVRQLPDGALTLVKQSSTQQEKGGTINGRLTDSASGRPVSGARVAVEGGKLAVASGEDGRFILSGVPAGDVIVTVRVLGFVPVRRAVHVTEGEATTINFVLAPAPTRLAEVVTTGSGDRRRVEVGNSIATINADSVVNAVSVTNLSDLLAARAPGLDVLRGSGSVGSSSRIRIRGIHSINASNDPIIIVDGVRYSNEALTGRDVNLQGVYDRPSRLDDIDINTIESIDVLKGPSASALYGSDAANGVIVIKTKQGRAGPSVWHLSGERNWAYIPWSFPAPGRQYGRDIQGGDAYCGLEAQASGACAILDSAVIFNSLSNSLTTPFGHGYRNTFNGDVSGGTQSLRYFFSGSFVDALGVSKLPALNERIIQTARGGRALPDKWLRPNALTNTDVTGSLATELNPKTDIQVRTSLFRVYQRRGDQGLSAANSPALDIDDTTQMVPGFDKFFHERSEDITRSFSSLNGHWRPLTGLVGRWAYGFDYAVDNDKELTRRGACVPICGGVAPGPMYTPDSLGYVQYGTRTTQIQTLDLGTTMTWPSVSSVVPRSSVGAQFFRSNRRDSYAAAAGLGLGRETPTGATGPFADEDSTEERGTFGVYVQQELAFRERLFITGALRRDAGSALGADVAPIFPKWGVSYLVSEEPFYRPIKPIVNNMRLRAAFGHAGTQPSSTAKLRLFGVLPGRYVREDGTVEDYSYVSSLGNSDLRPERSVELELGTDVGLFNERLRLEYTYARTRTRDAIIGLPVPPSLGSIGSISTNVGRVSNTSKEATLNFTAFNRPSVIWDMGVTYSSTKDRLDELGPNVQPFTRGGFFFGYADDARLVEGYPLFSRWVRPVVAVYDANKDGIIARSEVRFGDSLIYAGPSQPESRFAITQNLAFFGGAVRVTSLFDYVPKFTQINQYYAQGAQNGNAASVFIPGLVSPLEQAYANIAWLGANYGYLERVHYLRWSSLGVQFRLPSVVARAARSSRAELRVSGNNIALLTNYRGADPEVNSTGANGNRVIDEGSLPSTRQWGLRLSLTY